MATGSLTDFHFWWGWCAIIWSLVVAVGLFLLLLFRATTRARGELDADIWRADAGVVDVRGAVLPAAGSRSGPAAG